VANKKTGLEFPADINTETAVLGSIFNGEPPDFSTAQAMLNAGDFHLNKHKIIWHSMVRVAKAHGKVDRVLVSEDLNTEGKLQAVDGLSYISELDTSGVSLVNFPQWAKRLRETAVKRRTIHALQGGLDEILVNSNSIDNVIASTQEHLASASTELGDDKSIMSGDEYLATLDDGLHQLLHPRDYHLYLNTGFPQLDSMTYGMRGGAVWVLAGDTSSGKSALALNIAENIARSGHGLFFSSLEMDREELWHRILARDSSVPLWRIKKGMLGDVDKMLLKDAWEEVSLLPLYIDDTSSVTIQEFLAKLSKARRERGVTVGVVDYLQLLDWQSNRGIRFRDEREALVYATRAVKLYARDNDVPILVVSQLSYSFGKRNDKKDTKPKLSDLHGSSSISKDSDVVVFAHRPEFVDPKPENKGKADIIVAKNRGGPKGEVKMLFDGPTTTFSERDEEDTESGDVDII
jgi:replicative DNA helicase